MRTLQDIYQQFPTVKDTGLSPEQVTSSQKQYGANKLTPLPKEPLWKKFIEKFDEPIIKILLAAALLSMFVEIFRGHPEPAPGSPVVKGAIVLAGVMLGLFVAAIVALYVLKQQQWVPTTMFLTAILVFFLGGLVGGEVVGADPARREGLWSVEGLAVMIAVMLATGVAFAMEYKSDNEFEVLNAKKDAIPVKALRAGEIRLISLEEVVVGDLVQLEMGDEIPADGRIIQATELMIDQSLMTGESVPVRKHQQPTETTEEGPDKIGCVYRGTQVVDGIGQMIVADVGDATYLGQIARKLSAEGGDDEDDEAEGTPETEEKRVKNKLTISKAMTPLQVKLTALAELISKVGYIAAGLIFMALLIRGLIIGEVFWPGNFDDALKVGGYLLEYFVYMVIIIVVAVPEGLPMSVTVSLALAMQKMTRANSLVRQLVACETIGSATVICSDKTGTLTQNKMQVVRVFTGGQTSDRGTGTWALPDKDRPWPRDGKPVDWMALNSAVNSTANLEHKEGKLLTVGNTTEGSLLHWLHEAGIHYSEMRQKFPEVYQVHFNSERKRMTTVIRYGDRLVVLVKGAPEVVLGLTTQYQSADGSAQPWTAEARRAGDEWIKDSASQAMRTLGFAHAVLPADTPTDEDALHDRRDALEQNLTFTGFVAIRDPLREDVREAVDRCRRAGIEVKMITGDNVETARAISNDIGLVNRRDEPINSDGATIYTSDRFNELYEQWHTLRQKNGRSADEENRFRTVENQIADLRVLARARPLDKFKMVELLQSRQQVVGMTGDGTNDAPALKKADVGLAMGIAGTEVAKEASKIVLLDDAFSTIVKAVQWGRSLYENIQRFVQFQLTINVSALTIAFLGPFFNLRPPFTVLQLLWINVIMDTFAAIALCSEPPRGSVMNQPPKRKDESIVTPAMFKTIMSTAGFYVVVMMFLLLGMIQWGWFARPGEVVDSQLRVTPTQAGMFFSIYVFFQIFNLINCRSLTPLEPGWKNLFDNKAFLGIVGAIAVVQMLITEVPFIADIFRVGTLNGQEWLWVLAITPTVLIFAEIARQVRLRMERTDGTAAAPASQVQAG